MDKLLELKVNHGMKVSESSLLTFLYSLNVEQVRMSLREIGKKVGVSYTAVYLAIRELSKRNLISYSSDSYITEITINRQSIGDILYNKNVKNGRRG